METDKSKIQLSDFSRWIIEERRYILSGLIIPLLPLLFDLDWDFLKPSNDAGINVFSWIYKQIYDGRYLVMNILFILITLIILSKYILLLEKDDEKKDALHEYVRMQFGENSTLARNTPDDLYNRISKGIEQFYFSWLFVWGVWLALYITVFIFFTYHSNLINTGGEYVKISYYTSFRLGCLLENTFNLTNSFILLFIYLVITVSTVNVGSLSDNRRRVMHAGVSVFFFIGIGCFFTDMFSVFGIVDADSYDIIQLVIRIIIGLVATISLMAVLGRLNTNFLNIPQWMMSCLYLYAAIQMLYPLTYNSEYKSPDYVYGSNKKYDVSATVTYQDCSCTKDPKTKDVSSGMEQYTIKGDLKTKEKRTKTNSSKKGEEDKRKETEYMIKNSLSKFLDVYAFIGKGCLFLVISWINRKNRFLFFLIHKANTLSDSDVMLRVFNKYYEGCPDKK